MVGQIDHRPHDDRGVLRPQPLPDLRATDRTPALLPPPDWILPCEGGVGDVDVQHDPAPRHGGDDLAGVAIGDEQIEGEILAAELGSGLRPPYVEG
ncbi:hypothetical protein FHP29_07030 [Nocardioides albidus]|uniref:Uncharacterized protein n=1 Tax=Nocardioides albidus TaxID=1517589 RepID=A0A5C4W5C2_9ACTN|nr:hypothetical protein FHP29_07030 [Nocardioides albidus]